MDLILFFSRSRQKEPVVLGAAAQPKLPFEKIYKGRDRTVGREERAVKISDMTFAL